MKVRFACLTIGFAAGLALAASQSASAADWNSGPGSIKDYGGAGGVPVPAPVPIPLSTTAEWYIGIAAGGVLVDDSSIESDHLEVLDSDDLGKTMFGGISAGRYLTPSLRAEIAFDFYDDFRISGANEYTYAHTISGESTYQTPTGGLTFDTQHYDVTRTDHIKVGRTTGMFNMYYDLETGTRFRPYIGAGLGVTWRQMKHKWKAEGECHHTTNSSDNTLPTDSCVRNTDELPARFEESGESKVDQFDLALAAMAGFSMEIAPDILWDNGYQLLWENAALNITTTGCGPCTGTVSYGDTLQHHFRTGLRFNVN